MAVDPAEVLERMQARRLDRSEQAAIVAAREAWPDAGFEGRSDEVGLDPTRVAVVIGTGIGGVTSLLAQYDILLEKGPGPGLPAADPDEHAERSGGLRRARDRRAGRRPHDGQRVRVGRRGGRATGSTSSSSAAPTSSSSAAPRRASTRSTSPASRRCGRCRRATTTRERASRPFDKDRDGFVLGEGAGVLVIERASSAEARGRTPYAVLAGAGITADSYDIVAARPEGNGQRAPPRRRCAAPASTPADVVHVNAHATSTPAGDGAEARWIADLFGEQTVVTAPSR